MLISTARKEDLIPAKDGTTHINIYSKGRTELGRFLSHFQYHPIDTEDGYFESIEGYWYWLSTRDDRLRNLSGYQAKQLGDSLRSVSTIASNLFQRKILAATTIKLDTMPLHLLKELHTSRLPLIHAYEHNGKYTIQSSMDWIIKAINHRRIFLKVEFNHDKR